MYAPKLRIWALGVKRFKKRVGGTPTLFLNLLTPSAHFFFEFLLLRCVHICSPLRRTKKLILTKICTRLSAKKLRTNALALRRTIFVRRSGEILVGQVCKKPEKWKSNTHLCQISGASVYNWRDSQCANFSGRYV